MHIITENEFPRRVNGVAVLITQNIWNDGGVSYSLRYGEYGEYLRDEDFDHMPTDAEIRDALELAREE